MSYQSFAKMQKIADEHQVDLITRQILMRRRCEITEDDALIKIPSDQIKTNFGVSIDPQIIQGRGNITIVLKNVGDLYDLSPEEYEHLVESLSEIDLDTSDFAVMSDVDSELDEDEEDIFNSFQNRSKFTEEEDEEEDEEGEDENDTADESENEKPTQSNIVSLIKKEIKESSIALIEEITDKFGEDCTTIVENCFETKKDNDSVRIGKDSAFGEGEGENYIYDENDGTVSRSSGF